MSVLTENWQEDSTLVGAQFPSLLGQLLPPRVDGTKATHTHLLSGTALLSSIPHAFLRALLFSLPANSCSGQPVLHSVDPI